MLVAHIPAGYAISQLSPKLRDHRAYVLSSMAFAYVPDLDVIYHYLSANGRFHHYYFPHLPVMLAASLLLTLPLMLMKRFKRIRPYYSLFFVNWLLHLVMDTFTGGIPWLYPFSDRLSTLIIIPARFRHWVTSFVLHWSFCIELGIVAFSGLLLLKSLKRKRVAQL